MNTFLFFMEGGEMNTYKEEYMEAARKYAIALNCNIKDKKFWMLLYRKLVFSLKMHIESTKTGEGKEE